MEFKIKQNQTKNHFIWEVYSKGYKTGLITKEQAGDICSKELGLDFDESAFRKKYEAFEVMWTEVKHEYLLDSDDELIERLAKIEEKEDELYKAKVKTADKLREFRSTQRIQSRVENLMDKISESASSMPEINLEKQRNAVITGNKTAILKVSDWHLGKMVDNYFNKFNKDILVERVDKLIDETVKYCQTLGVKTLYIANLSDLIEGNLRVTSRVESEEDTIAQVMHVSEILSNMISEFIRHGYEVKYLSTLDNHSRANISYKEHIEIESFAKMIDWYLKARLGNSVEFITSPFDPNIGYAEINGKHHFFVHGHLKAHNIHTVVQNIAIPLGMQVDYVHMGHWHRADVKEFHFAKVFINGSLVGVDDYAFNNGWFSKASQKLLIVDDGNEIDINIILN
jgi:hypothetical protein